MKTILITQIIFLLFSFAGLESKADSMSCSVKNLDNDSDANHMYVINDSVRGTCDGKFFDISGVGIGLKLSMVSLITITCPGVTNANFSGRYYGVKVDIPVLGAGLYSGRKGLCAVGLFGLTLAIGGTGSVLTIYETKK